MIPAFDERPEWFKGRGYLHITRKLNIRKNYHELYAMLDDPSYVAKHAFFPLIHAVIKERKYKKKPDGKGRGHSFKKDGQHVRAEKARPLHYATHIDALIFGAYAAKLSVLYEAQLTADQNLNDSVIAYRKIPVEDPDGDNEKEVGKSTIHFAEEAFDEIKRRSRDGASIALMFDIKSFFSELDHDLLKKAWCDLRGEERLTQDEFNVFKAATDFRYILRDQLRAAGRKYGKRSGFDEAKLSDIRKHHGIEAFFSSVDDFKDALKQKKLRVYKHQFTKKKKPVGIPQGLPISAVLANLYLLNFDKKVLQIVTDGYGGFYRRYSDDIMIICRPKDADDIEKFILAEIQQSRVEISPGKTETYRFEHLEVRPGIKRLTSTLIKKNKQEVVGKPLTYLGFEFYGYQTLIKSANVAKFYRRMIYAIRKHAQRARRDSYSERPAIYPRQLRKLYADADLGKEKKPRELKVLRKNDQGYFSFQKVEPKSAAKPRSRTNYFSYSGRAAKHMKEPKITDQLKKSRAVFHAAMHRHLNKDQ